MDFSAWLTYLGITPTQLVPLVIVVGLAVVLLWRYFLKDLKEEVTDLHNATKEIQLYIQKDNKKWTPQHNLGPKPIFSYGQSNSPIIPNEGGKKLLFDSEFNNIYPKLKDKIFALMDSHNLRTLYDYEVDALKVLNELKDNPLMDAVKNYAVNHPNEPLELIFSIASWVIRDDYDIYKKAQRE